MYGAIIAAATQAFGHMANLGWQDKQRIKQNQFNAQQAQVAREWNQQMDNTKYQRQVADMQAAGVNPALAMQGGVSTQATSNAQAQASNPTPPQLDLSQVAQMAMQARQLKIQEKIADADVRLKNAEAENKETENKYAEEYNQLKNKGMEAVNNLTENQIKEINERIKNLSASTEKLKKEAATEEERKLLTIAERHLKETMERMTEEQRKQIVALLPFQKALMAAQTENQRAQASLNFVHAAYQQGLIDEGMIQASVLEIASNIAKNESQTTLYDKESFAKEMENSIKYGIFDFGRGEGKGVVNGVMRFSTMLGKIISDISPLSSFVGK